MQKLLFLFTRLQKVAAYDFVPYKFGCFSFLATYDLNVLSGYNLVNESEENNNFFWNKKDSSDYYESLTSIDKQILNHVVAQFRNFSQDELIKYTYLHFPYYAINSTILPKILIQRQIQQVEKERKKCHEPTLFTIGYEGKSIENYLNQLINNDIHLLIDVRKNALSMKYGFSKSQLKHACENLGIHYTHLPEMGIDSIDRRELRFADDYKKLFIEYEKNVLPTRTEFTDKIIKEIKINKRVALTCFEADHSMCHRSRIVNFLCTSPDWDIPVKHL